MTEQMVANGELPDVDSRLPKTPVLIQPVSEIGRYGGTWRMAIRRSSDHALLIRSLGYENLVRWNPEWTGVLPNIAQSYSVNEDATVYTFKLREGMRWSDGQPFTSEDIRFWFEDVLMNKELSRGVDAWRISNGKQFSLEILGDYEVAFRFEEPHGMFLEYLAAPEGAEATSYPAHFLKDLHLAYNGDADAQAKAEGYRDWKDRFYKVFGVPGTIDDTSRWTNPDLPVLHAWVLTGVYGKDEPLMAVRNPYYWKVDPAGQQLPYIDQIAFEAVESKSDARAVARAGRVDMQLRHMNDFADEVFRNPQDWPDFDIFEAIDTDNNTAALSLNLNHRDPVLREIFQNKNVRIALSHAIDRTAIINNSLEGRGKPFQVGPRPESPFYNEQLAKQYVDYDEARAKALLDQAGLPTGPDGIRLRPDGKPVSVFLDTVGEKRFEVIQEVAKYWRAVGIDVTPRNLERSAFYDMRAVNEHDISAWGGDGGIAVMLSPIYYFPYTYESLFATRWARWFQSPDDPEAEIPPTAVRRQMDLYHQLTEQGDRAKRSALMSEILQISADEFLVMGISLPPVRHGIFLRHMGNIPPVLPAAWTYPTPAPTNPSQYFIR